MGDFSDAETLLPNPTTASGGAPPMQQAPEEEHDQWWVGCRHAGCFCVQHAVCNMVAHSVLHLCFPRPKKGK